MRPNVHSSTIYNSQGWKQPKHPPVIEWIKKLWYIYIMEYCAIEKLRELLSFAIAWMNLENIMVSKISLSVKDKYHMISSIRGMY